MTVILDPSILGDPVILSLAKNLSKLGYSPCGPIALGGVVLARMRIKGVVTKEEMDVLTKIKGFADAAIASGFATAVEHGVSLAGGDTQFERFWEEYPKKIYIKEARIAWQRAVYNTGVTVEVILSALKWQKKSKGWIEEGGKYIPRPGKYLDDMRWLDEKQDDIDSLRSEEVKKNMLVRRREREETIGDVLSSDEMRRLLREKGVVLRKRKDEETPLLDLISDAESQELKNGGWAKCSHKVDGEEVWYDGSRYAKKPKALEEVRRGKIQEQESSDGGV